MKKKTRILVTALSMLVVAVLSISFTLAFLSDERTVTNTFEFGEVRVNVTETAHTGSVAPGEKVAKDPLLANIGTIPCYVRATITFGDGVVGNGQMVQDFIQLGALGEDWELADGSAWDASTGSITVYYKHVLNPKGKDGDKTSKIFTNFTILAESDGEPLLEGINNSFNIIVKAEAVQSSAEGLEITSAQDAFSKLFTTP